MRQRPALKPEQIHIRIHQFCDNDDQCVENRSLLSASERQRADAFRFPDDRRRFVQSHSLLRRTLAGYTGTPPGDIQFETGFYGKPYLNSDVPVCFSLSHTKEVIAIAVSSSVNVGIDIEKQKLTEDIDDVARQFMSQDEYSKMQALEAGLKENYFYHCWVQKEALVKAAGKGIDDFLRNFSVMDEHTFKEEKIISTRFGTTTERWWLKTFELISGHVGAVCVESSGENTFALCFIDDGAYIHG